MIMRKGLVLLSGGQDSTTCLFWALQNFHEVSALNILYGQRHSVEAQAARKIVNIAGVDLHEIHADQIFKALGNSGLIETDSDISSQHKTDPSLPASFVPGRNIMFLTIAAACGYSRGINDIITGVCQTDYSGYPDCQDNTIKSVQVSLSLGLGKDITIHTPLMWMTKAETVLMAKNDLVSNCWKAMAFSHTCYEGKIPPCGKCPACKLRAKGFDEAGLVDPLISRLALESSETFSHLMSRIP